MYANAQARCYLLKEVRSSTLDKCMRNFGIKPPATDYPVSRFWNGLFINKPLQRAMSKLARTSGSTLSTFVEMIRGQTIEDYRPNKNLVSSVLKKLCSGYRHLDQPFKIAEGSTEVPLLRKPLILHVRPPNHGPDKYPAQKYSEGTKCVALPDLIEQWPELVVSPFGVVDKRNEDVSTNGRTIHDLSYPEGGPVATTPIRPHHKPDYVRCDALTTEILRVKREHPNAEIEVMAGDVVSAFRYISIHSNSVFLFAGRIEEENAIVIELSEPFGWSGSPGFYEILGGAICHVHGSQYNAVNTTGVLNYQWVVDQINVPQISDMNRSLRFAIEAILGAEAINDEKFTSWKTQQRVFGLEFDSVAETVLMPAS
ncbi:LOW QUALITY PROTEIN: hypothetical protein PHMEG_0009097 [Phytophthora megakarya]|uniref:Uncharacterized protein n=1 Tax=Phytophthora megakarya TaxID=4795 RepID=A0A225WIT5_9STRA|nr:LOW QUALITY PROTEIN: hypothetical protein PHMEG_0009097 [Phytophthora megakarya]